MIFPCLRDSPVSYSYKDTYNEESLHNRDLALGGRSISITETIASCRSIEESTIDSLLKVLSGTKGGNPLQRMESRNIKREMVRTLKRAGKEKKRNILWPRKEATKLQVFLEGKRRTDGA